jgi:CotH kinase protein/Putative metal-binding motif
MGHVAVPFSSKGSPAGPAISGRAAASRLLNCHGVVSGTIGRYGYFAGAAALAALAGGGCGGGSGAQSLLAGDGAVPSSACADLFDQGTLASYAVDINDTEWAALNAEFQNTAALESGANFTVYHPVTFHLGNETVSDAAIKLHGQSSWYQTVTLDGARAKMQFDVSFDKLHPGGSFHGVTKLVFDMPRSDWTFLHDRLAQHWLRQVGILAPCSASGTLAINGTSYGLYVVEEGVGDHVVEQFYPTNAKGDLWKGATQAETNQTSPDYTRLTSFLAAQDLGALGQIVDLQSSLTSWAAEALLNDSDGYYGGSHNFYLYDQGAAGYVFLPNDTDSTFDWLATFDQVGATDHPIYFWSARAKPAPLPGDKWMIVLGDAGWRARYAEAIAGLLAKWDVSEIQGWIDTWSQQIGAAADSDPHAWATADEIDQATQTARDMVAKRAAYLQTFVDCERGGASATDADADGYRWCDECDDANPAVHPGAAEICGNGVDDNCNGQIDEGC